MYGPKGFLLNMTSPGGFEFMVEGLRLEIALQWEYLPYLGSQNSYYYCPIIVICASGHFPKSRARRSQISCSECATLETLTLLYYRPRTIYEREPRTST